MERGGLAKDADCLKLGVMSELPSPTLAMAILGALVLIPGCAAPPPATSGARPVMIYDTVTGQLVSNDVYEMKPASPTGGR